MRGISGNKGVRALFSGGVAVDEQHEHATIIPGYAGGHPRLIVRENDILGVIEG
jgi:hypothetical protein